MSQLQRRRVSLVAKLSLLGVLAAAPLTAQQDESRGIALETGIINFGPLVTEERENFVRFGSNGGMETFYALDIASNGHYVRLLLAPTQVHVWPTDQTTTDLFGDPPRSTDPRKSRFDYRTVGDPRDDFLWGSLSGGWRFERSNMTVRLGGGLVSLSQTSQQWWGARVGIAPMVESSLGARWKSLEISCGGQVIGLGYGLGRWIVLEHAAGSNPEAGESKSRLVWPVHCGLGLRL